MLLFLSDFFYSLFLWLKGYSLNLGYNVLLDRGIFLWSAIVDIIIVILISRQL